MLFYNGEDPATGSAGGCTAAWMAAHAIAAPNERVMIEQGLEMKRPSEIFVRANRDAGVVNNVLSAATVSKSCAEKSLSNPQNTHVGGAPSLARSGKLFPAPRSWHLRGNEPAALFAAFAALPPSCVAPKSH